MPNEYQTKLMLDLPLEDLLLKLYSAAFLNWVFTSTLAPMLREQPELQAQLNLKRTNTALPKMRKRDTIALLLYIFKNQDLKADFFARLPIETQDALTELCWSRSMTLEELETATGSIVANANKSNRNSWDPPFILPDQHGFICLLKERYYYYGNRNQISKGDMTALLPAELRKQFKEVVPVPPEYHLLPIDSSTLDPNALRFSATQSMTEIKAAVEFIAQGHAKFTKSEKLSKPSIRKFRTVIRGAEFFNNPPSSDHELLRTKMLLGTVAFAGQTLRKKLSQETSPDSLKGLMTSISSTFLLEELLDHLRFSAHHPPRMNPDLNARLFSFFAKFPPEGKWISAHNLISYFLLRDETPSPIEFLHDNRYDYYSLYENRYDKEVDKYFTEIGKPVLTGYCFLLAALGLAEVAYTVPKMNNLPFSGLLAIRLSPLGEYIFGKRDSIDLDLSTAPEAEILLDANRLIATCRHLDTLTELSLNQLMERITEVRFKMTPKSLLGGCGSRKDLEARIALFRRVISPKPPPIWETFFTQILNRIAPLKPDHDWLVFKLDTDAETRRLFATDPQLRELCIKVEGFRIAVEWKNLKQLSKRLEQLGCLCPHGSLLVNTSNGN